MNDAAIHSLAETNLRTFASPLARRLAREAGLDIATMEGSGPHGRIIERDVKRRLADGAPAPRAAALSQGGGASTDSPSAETERTRKFFVADSYEEIPLDSMRKAIARRLTQSVQTIPHFYLEADCEIDALLRLREDFNSAAPTDGKGAPQWKVSINDFLVKALAIALHRVPDANVSFTPEALLRHKASDIGVAVSIPGGLVTPIIRGAQAKSLQDISREVKELASRARERKLKPMEYEGGASAISNLGMYGVKRFSAIINPPQATILAVGAAEQRVVVAQGAQTIANVMSVTLSCDHRAVDGALGATLLGEFKRLVEHPGAIFV